MPQQRAGLDANNAGRLVVERSRRAAVWVWAEGLPLVGIGVLALLAGWTAGIGMRGWPTAITVALQLLIIVGGAFAGGFLLTAWRERRIRRGRERPRSPGA